MEETFDLQLPEGEFHYYKPPILLRIKSSMIDGIVVIFFLFVATWFINLIAINLPILNIILFSTILLYEPISTALGQTIGQKMMRLQVVRFDNYESNKQKSKINIFAAIIRYFFKILLGWISLITISSNTYGRAIHDQISKSVMVST